MSKSNVKYRKPLTREMYPTVWKVLTSKEKDILSLTETDRDLLACEITQELMSIASNDYETYLMVLLSLGNHFKCRKIAQILHEKLYSPLTSRCDLSSDCKNCSMRWLF